MFYGQFCKVDCKNISKHGKQINGLFLIQWNYKKNKNVKIMSVHTNESESYRVCTKLRFLFYRLENVSMWKSEIILVDPWYRRDVLLSPKLRYVFRNTPAAAVNTHSMRRYDTRECGYLGSVQRRVRFFNAFSADDDDVCGGGGGGGVHLRAWCN